MTAATSTSKNAKISSSGSPGIESMTGFGEARLKIAGMRLLCRARSVNHRFLDVKLRVPRTDLMNLDLAIRKKLQSMFKRGAVELSVVIESGKEGVDAAINTRVAENYAKTARALAKKLRLKNQELTLDGLLRLPGVVTIGSTGDTKVFEEGFSEATADELLSKLIAPALEALKAARKSEGQTLALMITKHLDLMEDHLERIKALEGPEKERGRALIVERAQETVKILKSVSGAPISEEFMARLRDEAVFWIERRDFGEEKERLGMHLKEFRALLTKGSVEGAGRKLEFTQQEILREINTLGTKSQSPAITKHTIELKTILERIREQLANVE